MMVGDFNLVSKPVIKLFRQGKIDKVYEKIYIIAERLAINDTQHYQNIAKTEFLANKNKKDLLKDFTLKVLNYKKERIEYHLNKMISLLNDSLKKK